MNLYASITTAKAASERRNENEQQKERPIRATTTAQNQRQENKAIYQSYVNFHFN